MKQDTKWKLRDSEGKEYIIIDTEKVDMQEELNKMITKQMNEIERLKDLCNKYEEEHKTTFEEWKKAINIIKEVREYIEENQEEHKYTDRGGFTYTEGHFLRDSDTLLEILDKESNNDTK